MTVLIQKFGGTSLSSFDRIRNAVAIIGNARRAGYRVVVVASAMGDTTDQLLSMASNFPGQRSAREVDLLLSAGEQISVSLLSMALQSSGIPSIALTGQQAGIYTDGRYGGATIRDIRTEILQNHIDDQVVPVVAGFQGISSQGETTTLGRGGSDTTAIALAAYLNAERCDIYTDVSGVYSADPNVVSNAVKLSTMSYEQMLALAESGAQVLCSRAVEAALAYNVILRVRSSFEAHDEGTLVGDHSYSMPFCGVASHNSQIVASVGSIGELNLETISKLTESLASAGLNVELIRRIEREQNTDKIHIAISDSYVEDSVAAVDQHARDLNLNVNVRKDLSRVSVIGNFEDCKNAIHRAFKLLNERQLGPLFCAFRKPIRISLLMPQSYCLQSVESLHAHHLAETVSLLDKQLAS